jgi:hypothetical protein
MIGKVGVIMDMTNLTDVLDKIKEDEEAKFEAE